MAESSRGQTRAERLARLRKLGLRKGATGAGTRRTPAPPAVPLQPENPFLPGSEVVTPFGPAWVREERLPLDEHPELAEWLNIDPASLAAMDRNERLLDLEPGAAAFIDTETTGLSLGAGTYTFMIGVGAYEPFGSRPDEFVVRQFFMRHPGEERAQLHLVEEALDRATGIVSFNGRSFDMPLIHNRFILSSVTPPLLGAPHLDLLPPARRLWKARWGSCSLGNLERNVLDVQRTTEDVPGYLIPDIYRQYYLTGEATEMLARVFYHNLQDIVSMALLGARMARPFRRDEINRAVDPLDALECVSLGRCYDALGWVEASMHSYRVALERATGVDGQVMALRELSSFYKRQAWREQAAELWETWVSTVPGEDLTPYVELAKHHEWHTGQLPVARGWAAWALRIAESQPPGLFRDDQVAQLRHRLARIERKMAGVDPGSRDDAEADDL